MKRDIEAINRALGHVASDIVKDIRALRPDEIVRVRDSESEELERLFRDYPTLVQSDGVIGLGKSTVAGIIKRAARIERMSESVDNNFMLDKYYDDMAAFGPMLQAHLMNDRFMGLMCYKLMHPNKSLICDRSPYGDPWAFCEALCKHGLMSEDVKDFCQEYFKWRKKDLESRFNVNLTPDLLILLQQQDPNIGWKRAEARNREMEIRPDAKKGTGLTIEFYTVLHEVYNKAFPDALKSADIYGGAVLALPQDDVEISNAETAKGEIYILKAVKQAMKILYGFPA